ncbi:hypothetical protein C2G38_2311122 [Gigaspora rosea]|uniref:Uncharacterized protein n=1 Tax=Gigaspora rosea TaxID=44941 RepID=A0A397VB58_9GLOM|nr:hypothetical protein C2G38_2311122 [Gigaspora rosea]
MYFRSLCLLTKDLKCILSDIYTGYVDLVVKLDQTKRLLESVQAENQQKSQEIMILNNQFTKMQQYIESQKNEIEVLRGQLQKAYDNFIEVQNLYSEQYKDNQALIEQWNLRFADNKNASI